MSKDIKSFDDYVASLDQTVPVRIDEGLLPSDLPSVTSSKSTSVSPKRGRPPKTKTISESEPEVKSSSKIPATLQNGAQEQKIYSTLKRYKSSPIFAERLEHVHINEKMNLAELLEAQKQIKSIISLQFNRALVEKLFCKSIDVSETFMVQYLQWEHCRGIADDILSPEGFQEFQDELEELSMEMSTKYQPGPLVRLIAKVAVAVGSAVQERTNLIGNQEVEVPVREPNPKKE